MAEKLKFMTFNTNYIYDKPEHNGFVLRAGLIMEMILQEKPDIICLQEMTEKILELFGPMLRTHYTYVFTNREKDLLGEGLVIAVRSDAFQIKTVERFWLSDTPRIPGSKYDPDAKYVRICQASTVLDMRSNRIFRVYNNHFDNGQEWTRTASMKQVLQHLGEANSDFKLPFFLCGDLNAEPQSEPIQYAYKYEPFKIVDVTAKEPFSWHGFRPNGDHARKIDYIFADEETAKHLSGTKVIDSVLDGTYASDHCPVFAEFEL